MKKVIIQNILEKDSDVSSLVRSIVGAEGLPIINHLFGVKQADEFEIADELEEDVNFVRSVMYKMYTHKLVVYTRRRDAEKGWYIYTWQLIPNKIYHKLLNIKQEHMDKLYSKLEKEKTKQQSFHCKKCQIKLNFEKAMELSFSCFACGNMLQPLNNEKFIKTLNKEIKQVSEQIGLIRTKLNISQ